MSASSRLAVIHYFVFVLLLSTPFWVIGGFADWEPLPGIPVSALMVIVPPLVASAYIARTEGYAAALRWIKGAFSPTALRRVRWVLIAVLLPPATLAAAYVIMLLGGYSVPKPNLSVVHIVLLLAIFVVPAALEELGWCNFALAKLQQTMSALGASLVIGVVWAVWHLVPLLQAGRSFAWIGSWFVGTVALRVLITWIFNNSGGSVLLAALFHASVNVSWQSFPIRGSHYDPAIHAVVLVIVSGFIAATLRGKTLTREVHD